MKADLVRVASFANPHVRSFGDEFINATEGFPVLQKIIDRSNRNTIHVIGMYEPQGRSSAPVRVLINGIGSTDLVLASYERVNWVSIRTKAGG